MPASKKRKSTRKTAKRYEFVSFKSSMYDETFEFPKLDGAPLRVIEALNTGDIQHVSAWLRTAGADEEAIEAYRDLSQDELMDFISEWTAGEPVGLENSES